MTSEPMVENFSGVTFDVLARRQYPPDSLVHISTEPGAIMNLMRVIDPARFGQVPVIGCTWVMWLLPEMRMPMNVQFKTERELEIEYERLSRPMPVANQLLCLPHEVGIIITTEAWNRRYVPEAVREAEKQAQEILTETAEAQSEYVPETDEPPHQESTDVAGEAHGTSGDVQEHDETTQNDDVTTTHHTIEGA